MMMMVVMDYSGKSKKMRDEGVFIPFFISIIHEMVTSYLLPFLLNFMKPLPAIRIPTTDITCGRYVRSIAQRNYAIIPIHVIIIIIHHVM